MSVLILAHKRIQTFSISLDISRIRERFYTINQHGIISFLGAAIIIISSIIYIVALYAGFTDGARIRSAGQTIKILEAEIADSAHRTYMIEMHLMENRDVSLTSMERITDITYLTSDRSVSSVALRSQ